jgi:hypothetical protein
VPGEPLAIVHDIPGRLRIRLPATARVTDLEAAVTQLPGVASCRWSPRTRSLLTTYRPDEVAPTAIVNAIVDHAGVDPDPAPFAPEPSADRPSLVAAIIESVRGLDRRVGRITGGGFTLGVLVPLALTLWALRDATRGPIQALPWSSALWYAHGLFRDYNLPRRE